MTNENAPQPAMADAATPAPRGGLVGAVRNLAFASIGIVGVMGDELQSLYQRSVQRGGSAVQQMQQARHSRRQNPKVARKVRDEWAAQFARMGIPTKDDVDELTRQIAALEEEIDRLSKPAAPK